MILLTENLACRSGLDNFAIAHDHHVIRHIANDRKIMSDENQCKILTGF